MLTTLWVMLKLVAMELLRCTACDIKLFALSTEKLCTCKLPTLACSVPFACSVFPHLLKVLTYSFIHSLIHYTSIGWVAMGSDAGCALHKSTHPVAAPFLSVYYEQGPDDQAVVPAAMELTV